MTGRAGSPRVIDAPDHHRYEIVRAGTVVGYAACQRIDQLIVFARKSAATGAVTLIQRFGSGTSAPGTANRRTHRPLARTRRARHARHGQRLARLRPVKEAPVHRLLEHSITYRIATGPREGQKVFTLQTLPPDPELASTEVAEASGFSLHVGVAAKGGDREKLERLARYIARPPIATARLALTEGGYLRYALKTAYRDGTTHVLFEPMDFIARLAALVPKPGAHLTRFAPHSALRDHVVPQSKAGRPMSRVITFTIAQRRPRRRRRPA